jgi:threonine/homoserine/homoserine lactone efflux protein
MTSSLVFAAIVFALVNSITPGPNNLMLAASGLTFGFRRTVPLLLGIHTGFQLLLLGVAVGLGQLFDRVPAAQTVLKVVGVAYLLWLAWKLWNANAPGSRSVEKPIGFFRGLAFQVVNPKAWMMTLGAASAYTLSGEHYWTSVWMLVGVFVLMGLPSITVWAAFGAVFRGAMSDPRTARIVGRAMAVLTALSCGLILI